MNQVVNTLKSKSGRNCVNPPEWIAYVDKTRIDTYLYREYGYALRSHKINAAIYERKCKRVGLVAVQLSKEIISPLAYSDTMDRRLFEYWLEQQLLPALPPNAVSVTDNASFHRSVQLIHVAQTRGCCLIFLSAYSPEFNPIENSWVWFKWYLHPTIFCFPSFDDVIFDVFQVC